MGDSHRNAVFVKFIQNHWPKAQRVLCVADGNGELSVLLADAGYLVRAIEPHPRHLVRHQRVSREKKLFSDSICVTEDLIVAMHPDEATAEVILAAKRYHIPFAVVPCCVKGRDDIICNVSGRRQWVNKLISLAGGPTQCSTFDLPIDGANTVVYSIGCLYSGRKAKYGRQVSCWYTVV